MPDQMSRRAVLLGLAGATLLAGCTHEEIEPAPSPPAPGDSPQVLEHRYGTTQLSADPQRVVTLGLVDHDAVLALDMIPVALTAGEYSAGNSHGVWPWAQHRLGGGSPEVLPDTEINFDRHCARTPRQG